ncbi:Crp/Fnr family transcriptional regulator [Mucilaginibacter jinjuensis]|uniref:Crp/Fnr family transcriptional regulator n=1 Tax=Mucilaginibacter jinjuensis TaxID=1176721 RepID=A0ABY7TBM1_9SPHI|nr:Crp/Fnr family transcriptional regulator [Mucilaginibacter jinjuensis]WCT13465.1 Crp/Fnr family transcriptional regulator [Mucilaginibacter jinjuensis]
MTDTATFMQRLNKTKLLPVRMTNLMMESLRVNRFEAHETFLSPGNYAGSIYFIQSGLVRGAIEGSSEKITTWFKQEGDIILPSGIFTQLPSEEYIAAVAKTTLLALPFKHIQNIITANAELMELFVLLLSENNNEAHSREKLLRLPSAKDRYNFISQNQDFVLKRVPHYLIASYLNVTKETFSRLHKGLDY